ncbi:DUF4129 domain-containing protein [Mycobacterium deserti]|uniref:DUF4129 domain-containing protein n=1 Tax=Mycobacterium deserti TaxID=2978347 RepID=A0ABT2MJX4_9MYCO|nr:DUF4129 domain-containing protein [Mycobacterium deserti]MCT7661720.1 DUF4129 domain-containing protein [Mycobacterium deserti]
MPTVDIDRDAAYEAAQRELGKANYPKPSLSERALDWIEELLDRLTSGAASLPGGWFTAMILLLLLTAAMIVAVRIANRTLRTRRGHDDELFGDHLLSAAAHRATAEHFAAVGDWSAAIRHRLRAIARQLEETGVVDPVPGRTASELARDAGRALPALSSELAGAAIAFNDVTYGERPGTELAYRTIADLDGHLLDQPPRPMSTADAPANSGNWAEVR